jgi:hypothetical protein
MNLLRIKIALLNLIIAIACVQCKQTLIMIGETNVKERLLFPKELGQSSALTHAEITPSPTKELRFFDYNKNRYYFYDFQERKLIKSLDYKFFPYQQVFGFSYLSSDSVYVLLNPATINPHYYHDSIFFRFNEKRQALQMFSMYHTDCIQKSKKSEKEDEMYVGLISENCLQNGKFFVKFNTYEYEAGDTVFTQKKQAISGFFDVNTGDYFSIPVFFPSNLGETYSRIHSDFVLFPTSDERVLYSFNNKNFIAVWDIKKQSLTYKNMNSVLIDSIRPIEKFLPMIERPSDEYEKGIYDNILFNPFEQRYYRNFSIKLNGADHLTNTLIVYDKQFNRVG